MAGLSIPSSIEKRAIVSLVFPSSGNRLVKGPFVARGRNRSRPDSASWRERGRESTSTADTDPVGVARLWPRGGRNSCPQSKRHGARHCKAAASSLAGPNDQRAQCHFVSRTGQRLWRDVHPGRPGRPRHHSESNSCSTRMGVRGRQAWVGCLRRRA